MRTIVVLSRNCVREMNKFECAVFPANVVGVAAIF